MTWNKNYFQLQYFHGSFNGVLKGHLLQSRKNFGNRNNVIFKCRALGHWVTSLRYWPWSLPIWRYPGGHGYITNLDNTSLISTQIWKPFSCMERNRNCIHGIGRIQRSTLYTHRWLVQRRNHPTTRSHTRSDDEQM